MDNPSWGNNVEASTSTGYRRPRLELVRNDSAMAPCPNLVAPPRSTINQVLVLYDQEFAVRQILSNLHSTAVQHVSLVQSQVNTSMVTDVEGMALDDQMHPEPKAMMADYFEESETLGVITPIFAKKRKTRGITPIVDEVRRCSRFRKEEAQEHIQLNNEPRRKNGEAKKSLSISMVEDLRKVIVSRSLERGHGRCSGGAHPGFHLGWSWKLLLWCSSYGVERCHTTT